jgi:hypothetical protein
MFMSQANVNSLVDRNRLVGQYFITNEKASRRGMTVRLVKIALSDRRRLGTYHNSINFEFPARRKCMILKTERCPSG